MPKTKFTSLSTKMENQKEISSTRLFPYKINLGSLTCMFLITRVDVRTNNFKGKVNLQYNRWLLRASLMHLLWCTYSSTCTEACKREYLKHLQSSQKAFFNRSKLWNRILTCNLPRISNTYPIARRGNEIIDQRSTLCIWFCINHKKHSLNYQIVEVLVILSNTRKKLQISMGREIRNVILYNELLCARIANPQSM